MRATAAAILVVAGLTASCDDPATPDLSASMRPDLITIEPGSLKPGETAALGFPSSTRRGQAFTLELSVDGSWKRQYFLISAPSSADNAAGPSWTPGDQGLSVLDIAIHGPGPDLIVIPPGTEPGDYRICTANVLESFCTAVLILQSN